MPVMTMARWIKNPVLLGPKPSVLRVLRGVLAGIGVPNVGRWYSSMMTRPAVIRGFAVPMRKAK